MQFYSERQQEQIKALQAMLFDGRSGNDDIVVHDANGFGLTIESEVGPDARIVGRREWCCYQNIIARMGCGDLEPRHVEAFMRTQYGTLDHLDTATFRREIELAALALTEYGRGVLDSMAKSQGL